MGGAERRDRQRRQAQARARAAGVVQKRGIGGGSVALTVVAVVVILAIIVGVVITMQRTQSAAAGPEPTYPVSRTGVVVTAGQPTAPLTVDLYADYLCPACAQFESVFKAPITTALNDGKMKLNIHPLGYLDTLTAPAGYSTRAANAAICSVDAGIFTAYNEKLFTEQPAEGGAGLTNEQLIAFGTELGAGDSFAQCVNAQSSTPEIAAATEAAANNPDLQTSGQGFGTPTIAIDGKKVDINSNWLPA